MWQQNCVLRKFGLLKSCQPITSHRPTDRQNPVLISLAYRLRLRLVPSDLTNRFSYLFLSEKVPACLSVTNTIIPKWFDNLFFTCFSVRKPQPASRLGLSGWPNRCKYGFPGSTDSKNIKMGSGGPWEVLPFLVAIFGLKFAQNTKEMANIQHTVLFWP